MSPDAVQPDTNPEKPEVGPGDRTRHMPAAWRQQLQRSPLWQIALALSFVVIAAVGLCRVSGLSDRLRPLPMPTDAPTPGATRTLLPTWTATPTPQPTPTATNTATPVPVVMAGGDVVVAGTGPARLRLRAGPGLTQETLMTLDDGMSLAVLEGPVSADEYEWWKVRTEDGQEGWVAGDWLSPAAP